MGLFKKIVTAYRTAKQGKEVCCQNLSNKIEDWHHKLEEQKPELEERMKKTYEEYKSSEKYTDINAFNDYLTGRITQKEYEEHDKDYNKFVKQKIKETDEGKITHQEFFDAIYSR